MSQENEYTDAEVKETEGAAESQNESLSVEQLKKSHSVQMKKMRENNEAKERENKLLIERLNDLEKKVNSGTATQNQNLEYQQNLKALGTAEQKIEEGTLNPDMIQAFVKHQMAQEKLADNLKDATTKDEEFKELMQKNGQMDPQDQKINLYEVSEMAKLNIKNPSAVVKHLLKNDKDAHIMRLAFENSAMDNGQSFANMIYNLSEKIDAKSDSPRPSSYTPAPRMSDAGHSDDFEEADYIKNKYK